MTETPQQERPSGEPGPDATQSTQSTQAPGAPGLDRDHLRNYQALRRSVTDRKLAGVAGGLGRHLNIDPTIIRVTFVVLTLFGGAGVLLYGLAWLIVPEEGKTDAPIGTNDSTRNTLLLVGGIIAALIVIGNSWGGFGFPLPLAVLALIVAVVLMTRDRNSAPPPGTPATPSGPPPYVPPSEASTVTAETAPLGAPVGSTVGAPAYPAPAQGGTPPPWMPPTQQPYQPPRPSPKTGPLLFGPTLALIAVALGSLGLYDATGGVVADAAYPALALAVTGLMLVVGAWIGRAGGLILVGVITAIALSITSLVGEGFSDGGQMTYRPQTGQDVRTSYELSAGQLQLDLRDVDDLEALDNREITVSGRVGEIIVLLPDGLRADVQADVRMGDTLLGGQRDSGPQVEVTRRVGSADINDPTIELDLDLLAGHIEVRQ